MKLLHIGEAVQLLENGHKVAREGWNGKNMYLFLVPPGATQVPHKFGNGYMTLGSVWMKTVDDTIVPWLCSQTDLLSKDWVQV